MDEPLTYSWSQLEAAYTAGELRGLLRHGALVRVRRGWYRWRGTPDSWPVRLHAAVGAAGPGAAAAMRSAGRLLGMANVPALRLEVVVPRARRVQLEGVTVHRSNLLLPHHVTSRHGIAVTVPARTACDLSAVLSLERMVRILDAPATRRLVSPAAVLACRDELRARGRRRTTVLDQLLVTRVEGFDGREEDAESRVARWLKAAGFAIVEQHWVVVNGHRYCLDAALLQEKIDIETDGFESHGTRSQFEHDRRRDADLQLAGWLVLRFHSRSPRDDVVGRTTAAAEQRRRAA